MKWSSKIYVAGHRGMVGSALVRKLKMYGFQNLILRNSDELDLTDQILVRRFFVEQEPEYIFLAAAKVGGIYANNTYPADFAYINMSIAANVINAAHQTNAKKLLYLGSSCIYPKFAPQPLKEEYLLDGHLEPTNRSYAIAKIAGIELCRSYRQQFGRDFISVMPTNLYGPNDNYHPTDSHVLPALIRKILLNNGIDPVNVWGTGSAKREFLHVDDLAEACIFLMRNYSSADIINIGSGDEMSIIDLAMMIAEIADKKIKIQLDPSKPDGTPRKILDSTKIGQMGWKRSIGLPEGIQNVIEVIKENPSILKIEHVLTGT